MDGQLILRLFFTGGVGVEGKATVFTFLQQHDADIWQPIIVDCGHRHGIGMARLSFAGQLHPTIKQFDGSMSPLKDGSNSCLLRDFTKSSILSCAIYAAPFIGSASRNKRLSDRLQPFRFMAKTAGLRIKLILIQICACTIGQFVNLINDELGFLIIEQIAEIEPHPTGFCQCITLLYLIAHLFGLMLINI